MSTPPLKAVEVAAGLVFHQGKLLITQRRKGDHLGNLWEFPGGKREGNETFAECLIRELQEELDIEVEVFEAIETVDHSYPEKTVHLRFFRCGLKAGSPKAIGCQDLAWIHSDQLCDYPFPAADEKLLTVLANRKDLWEQ